MSGSDMRATPPSRRMSAGTRSSAITAQAPASSAIFACSASTTSMITPPFSISARPLLTRIVPISLMALMLARSRQHRRDRAEGDLRLVEPRLARRQPLQREARQRNACQKRRELFCTMRQSSIVSASESTSTTSGRPERGRERQRPVGEQRHRAARAPRSSCRSAARSGSASRRPPRWPRGGAPRPRRSRGARRRAGAARGRGGS